MLSVGADAEVLLMLVVGILTRQHAVKGDDDILKLRALKVPDYDFDNRWDVFNDLFNIVAGSDVTALMWTNRIAAAHDAVSLCYLLNERGFLYSVETSNDSAYSFYYNRTTFSNASAESINLDSVEQLFVATFEFTGFDGGFLPVAALYTNIRKLLQLGSYIARYRDYPLALFGKFGPSLLKTLTDGLQEQTEHIVLNKEIESHYATTKPVLLLNGMARSLISVQNQKPKQLGLLYIKLCPVYSAFNLTMLKGELSSFTRKLQPAYTRRYTDDGKTGHISLWRPTPEPSVLHPHERGQPVELLRGRSPRIASFDRPYDHIRPSTSSGVYTERSRAGSFHAPQSQSEQTPHQILRPDYSPQREEQEQLRSVTSTDHLYQHRASSRPHFFTNHRIRSTTGYSSPNQHAVHGDDTLRIGALVVPKYDNGNTDVLNRLLRVVWNWDVALLMWNDPYNSDDTNALLDASKVHASRSYSVRTSTDRTCSFYYDSNMFTRVSIQLIPIDVFVDERLYIATFEWADLHGASFSIVTYSQIIIQTKFLMDLDSFFRQYYEDTSLVFFANFITEKSNPVTQPILFMNNMKTSLIRHSNPILKEELQYYFNQPPLYLEFNLTELKKPQGFQRERRQDRDGAGRPTSTDRNLDSSRADHFLDSTSTQRDFSPRQYPQPSTIDSAVVHTSSSSQFPRFPTHVKGSSQLFPNPPADSAQLPAPRVRPLLLKRKPGEEWKVVDSTWTGNGSPYSGGVDLLSPVQAEQESRNPRKMYIRQLR